MTGRTHPGVDPTPSLVAQFQEVADTEGELAERVLDATGLVIIVTEAVTGMIVRVSAATEALTGLRASDLLGRPVWEALVASRDRAAVRAAYADPTGVASLAAYVGAVPTRAGEERRVLWSRSSLTNPEGLATHIVMTGIDLEPDGLDAGVLNHLTRAATDAACLATDLSGRVTFLGTAAERMLGYRAGDLIGRPLPAHLFEPAEVQARAAALGQPADLRVLTISPPRVERRRRESLDLGELDRRSGGARRAAGPGTDRRASPGADSRAPEGHAGPDAQQWTIVRQDGVRFVAAVTVHKVMSAGEHVGFLAIGEDITEQQQTHGLLIAALEREREAVERVRELDRAKSAFVATVSHELRTPMASLAGYVELLQDDLAGPLTAAQTGFVAAIARNTDRLRALTDDLLVLTGLGSGAFMLVQVDLDLRDLVLGVEKTVGSLVEGRRLDVSFEHPNFPVMVNGDAQRLERVLFQLVSNAVKVTADGGRVACRLRVEGGDAVLEVEDTGIGIPAHEHERIFTPFFRTSAARKLAIQGTGLGLSIAAPIIEAHAGIITVVSEPQCGALFTVRLPLVTAQP